LFFFFALFKALLKALRLAAILARVALFSLGLLLLGMLLIVNIFFQPTRSVGCPYRVQIPTDTTCPLISSFQTSVGFFVCLSAWTVERRRLCCGTTGRSRVPSTAFEVDPEFSGR